MLFPPKNHHPNKSVITRRKGSSPGGKNVITRRTMSSPGAQCHHPAHNVITRLVRVIQILPFGKLIITHNYHWKPEANVSLRALSLSKGVAILSFPH
jgi:hypothetical protein